MNKHCLLLSRNTFIHKVYTWITSSFYGHAIMNKLDNFEDFQPVFFFLSIF